MIVHDFRVPRLAVAPDKTDPPLLVDADAVLPGPVALEPFQAVAGRIAQVVHRCCRIERMQFCLRPLLDLRWQSFDAKPGKNRCRALVGKGSDHGESVPVYGTIVKIWEPAA